MRRTLAAVGAVALLALSGCTARVSTAFEVSSPSSATVRASVAFTGEAAAVLAKDKGMQRQLAGVFHDRTGSSPEIDIHEDLVEVTQELRYSDLTQAGDLLGVSSAALRGDSGQATLTVGLTAPSALADAVRAATAKEPDAHALAETMLRSTDVVVDVEFAGGVDSVSGARATRDGSRVTVVRNALDTRSAQLVVVGDPTWDWWKWALAPFVALGLVLGTWRRHS